MSPTVHLVHHKDTIHQAANVLLDLVHDVPPAVEAICLILHVFQVSEYIYILYKMLTPNFCVVQ